MNHNIAEYNRHQDCEAKTPLGSTWLANIWRENQPCEGVMDFMALASRRDSCFGNWTITMLVLLHEVNDKCQLGKHQ